jgi:hypothetical protein
MFTIEYKAANGEHQTQVFDTRNRLTLAKHLSRFNLPIVAVYEQATAITKAMQSELKNMPHNRMSRHALSFIGSRAP